jgi:repressor LexA
VKYLHRKNGGFELRPANAAMSPIVVDDVQVVGKVTGMLRSFR